MIQAVVWDIGRVLIDWNPERVYDRLIGADRRKQLFKQVDLHGYNLRIDAGAPFVDTMEQAARDHPDHAPQIRLWCDNWIDMVTPEIPRSVRLLRALKARGVPVFALSNFGVETFELARAAHPFLDLFDRRYISGHLRTIKPQPRIYEILEQDSGIAPDRLLFTDDRPENIAAAQARGWHTHLFDTPQGWADCLASHTLLTPKECT